MDEIEVTGTLPAPPARIWAAWVDGAEHGEMTGGPATSEPRVGGAFTAWDGYIRGEHLVLESARRIVQTWRTSEFPDGAADSRLEILLEPDGEGTRITLRHTSIPAGQGERYRQGWVEHYLEPMRAYFGS